MANIINESAELKSALASVVREVVRVETKDCFRTAKAIVVSAPNGTTCGVQLVGDDKTLNIPYSSKVSSVSVGDSVLVGIVFGSFRNAVVWERYNFQ